VNERIRKENQQLLWLLVAATVGLTVLSGILIWQSRERVLQESGPIPVSTLQSLPAPSTSTLLSLATTNSLAVGQPAPDFSLKTLDGQSTVTLSELRGKPIILNFWASWCLPCRQEMPALQRAYDAHRADGLTVLAINYGAQDSLLEAQSFVKELQLTMPVLSDEESTAGDAYHVLGLPTTYFVDSQGVITRTQFGPLDETQLDGYISALSADNN
jgi:peroxiredoxin